MDKWKTNFGEVAVEANAVEMQKVAMNNDKTKVDEKAAEYAELVQSIQEKAQIDTESKRLKYSVPTLLQKIMSSIPSNVQLTSIRNSGNKVTITAQSDRYEQIGIFSAKLEQDGILVNVVSDKSTKQNEVVTVTIEGELP